MSIITSWDKKETEKDTYMQPMRKERDGLC